MSARPPSVALPDTRASRSFDRTTCKADNDHDNNNSSSKGDESSQKKKKKGKTKNKPGKARYWDYTIDIGPDHLIWEEDDEKLLKQMRASWDRDADRALEEIERFAKEEDEAGAAVGGDDVGIQGDGESRPKIDEKAEEVGEANPRGGAEASPSPCSTELATDKVVESDGTATMTAAAALAVNVAPVAETASQDPKEAHSKRSAAPPTNRKKPRRDFYELFERYHDRSPILGKLWDEVNTVPEWVDWDEIARGQDVFYRYAGPMFVGLTYSSLLGGLGAARVVEVLARTGGFNEKVVRGRLYETTQFILEVTRGLDSMKPISTFVGDGYRSNRDPMAATSSSSTTTTTTSSFSTEDIRSMGWKSCLRVRFLHASVRRRILTLTQTHPTYYDTAAHGIPINDLHSIGTIVTFAPWLLFRSLPRQGIFPTASETTAYLSLWRLIAHYLGTPHTPYFLTSHRSRTTMEVLMMHEISPSPLSRILATNILTALSDTPPAYPSRPFLEASSRWINGHTICDGLGLSRPRPHYYILVAGQCLFFVVWTYWHRLACIFLDAVVGHGAGRARDAKRLANVRRICWLAIVESRYGLKGKRAEFGFRFVPQLGMVIPEEEGGQTVGKDEDGDGVGVDGERGRGGTSGPNSNKWVKFEEKRAMKTLAVVGGVAVASMWVLGWMAWRVFLRVEWGRW